MTYILAVVFFLPVVSHSQQVQWRKNFDEAKVDALTEGKLILIYFESTSDEHCFTMDSEMWNQPAIIKMSKRFVCVKIDFEQMRLSSNMIRKDRNQKLAVRYRVSYLPTTVFIDLLGNIFLRVEGFVRAPEMMEKMETLPTDLSSVYFLLAELEKTPDNVGMRIAAADSFRQLNLYEASNMYYRETAHTDTVRRNQKLSEHVDMSMARNYAELNEVHAAIDLLERMLDKYPGSAQRPEQLYLLARLNLQALNEIRAREYLDVLEKNFPESPFTKRAARLLKN
ncbi:MAG: thioredoxin family protein [Bacteroidota bacterium]